MPDYRAWSSGWRSPCVANSGVPILDPNVTGLVTADRVHLLEESAERYARAFTRLLEPFLPRPE